MERKDVPQDRGIAQGLREVCYAVDDSGRYVLVESLGWEPKNIANDQAWEVIDQQVAHEADRVRQGLASPLAYYMAKHLMHVGLLAQYVGLPRWRVKRHLKPGVFKRLKPALLARYAAVFEISVGQLVDVSGVSQLMKKDGP